MPTPWDEEDEHLYTHHKCDTCGLWVPLEKWRPDMSAHGAFYRLGHAELGLPGIWGSPRYDVTCEQLHYKPSILCHLAYWLLGETPKERARRALGLSPKR